jgi:hypothetical protein
MYQNARLLAAFPPIDIAINRPGLGRFSISAQSSLPGGMILGLDAAWTRFA